MKHTLSYREGHPNPQKFREDYTLLDGEWKFAFDVDDLGTEAHYERNFPDDCMSICVPYPYQSPASGINLPQKQCDVIWYEREFEVSDTSKRQIITFGSVDYLCRVYVNGMLAVEHEGGYDSFECDATPFIKSGTNKLTLRVEDRMHMDQIRGKQRWRRDSWGCHYVETSGIVRSVYLEELGECRIADFTLRGDYSTSTLTLDVRTENAAGKRLCVTLTDADGELTAQSLFALSDSAEVFTLKLDGVRAWSHEDAYLYNVALTLLDGETVLDRVLSYCGFISFAAENGRFFINGEDTYLKLVLNQGYWEYGITTLTEEQIIKDIECTLACGFNGARMHEHTPSPLNLYYMDLYGLYAWQECPSAYGYSFEANKQYRKQFPRIIRDHYSHPCIMTYVLFNESWGTADIYRSKEVQDMTVDIYRQVKAISGTRFVISNDGWEHTVSDIITFHNYLDTYGELKALLDKSLDDMYKGENTICVNAKKFFANGYKYGGEPVMLSEFAGISFTEDNASGWGYGRSVGSEADFLERYGGQLKFIHERREIRGFCMTQLTDVYQEKNGLFTSERAPKISCAELSRLHSQFN